MPNLSISRLSLDIPLELKEKFKKMPFATVSKSFRNEKLNGALAGANLGQKQN